MKSVRQALTMRCLACVLALPAFAVVAADPPPESAPSPLLQRLVALDNPYGMEFLPDGSLLITEKPGKLRVWRDGQLSEPVQGVPKLTARSQGGLLDVAVDPGFARNRLIYLSYSEPANEQPGGVDIHDPRLGPYQELDDAVVKGLAVAQARLEGSALRNVRVIWRAFPKTVGRGHFAGRLAFAHDGTLFITSGDRQRFEPAQDLGSDLGKIIRIRTDGSAPSDNPFANGPEAQRDVWSYGHRNTLGIVVHPATGEVWVNEMGPLHGDEFGRVVRGGNHGWPLVSEGDHYDTVPLPRASSRADLVPPMTGWWPAISPSGMVLYSGRVYPAWEGSFLIGGLSSKSITRVTPVAGGRPQVESILIGERVRDLAVTAEGELLVMTDGPQGALNRLRPERLAQRR